MTFFLKEGGKNRDLKPWFLDRCGSGTYEQAKLFFYEIIRVYLVHILFYFKNKPCRNSRRKTFFPGPYGL